MPDAVIVDTLRTPIGRAFKGSLAQLRPDEMGAYVVDQTAVNVAKRYEVSRADMDKYAQRSQELAVKSEEDGFFDREIVPVKLPDGTEVARDDGPRPSSTLEKLAELPEAFGGGGVTA